MTGTAFGATMNEPQFGHVVTLREGSYKVLVLINECRDERLFAS